MIRKSGKIEAYMMFDVRKSHERVLLSAVKAVINDETAQKIVYGGQALCSAEDDATWVRSSMKRLEQHFDKPTVKKIRMSCQCGYGMDEKVELVKELVGISSDLENFANHEKAKAAGLSCSNGDLFLQFPFCPCPMLADVNVLKTDSWCQCTTGYSKVLFEKAFGCDVDVELLQSVKMGDAVCLMKIIPRGAVWK